MRIGQGSHWSYVVALLIVSVTLALPSETRLSAQENASKKAAQTITTKQATASDREASTHSTTQLHADMLLLEVPEKLLADIIPNDTAKHPIVAASALSHTPQSVVVLSDDQHERVIKWTGPNSKAGVKILDRPTITVRNGEPAAIHMDGQVPVVVGFNKAAAQPRVVQRGIGFHYKIKATLSDDERTVNMDCSFSHGAIDKQREQPVMTVNGIAVQQPSIKYRIGSFETNVPIRGAVAYFGAREQRDGSDVAQVFVVTITPAPAAKPAS